MPHELFLTTREATEIRNVFANNVSADIKLSKAQMSKILQSCRFLGFWLANLGKKALKNVAICLARDNLFEIVINLASNAINKFERKARGKRAVRGRKRFTWFVLNEDMKEYRIKHEVKRGIKNKKTDFIELG